MSSQQLASFRGDTETPSLSVRKLLYFLPVCTGCAMMSNLSHNVHFEFISYAGRKELPSQSVGCYSYPQITLGFISMCSWHDISLLASSKERTHNPLGRENGVWGGEPKTISKEIQRRKPTPGPQTGISDHTRPSETPFKLEDDTVKASLCYLGRPCLTNKARENEMGQWVKVLVV